jgi:hypothetical protein
MDDDVKDLAPHYSKKPNYTMISGLLSLLVVGVVISLALYYIYELRSMEFMAGCVCACALWQVNYRNCYGKWFDYL